MKGGSQGGLTGRVRQALLMISLLPCLSVCVVKGLSAWAKLSCNLSVTLHPLDCRSFGC